MLALTEGAFTRLFRRSVSARDIAVLLLRAMENEANRTDAPGSKPVAPENYCIYLHPDHAERLLARIPNLTDSLSGLIAELSRETGFQRYAAPRVSVLPDQRLAPHQARVSAEHGPASSAKTEKMAAAPAAETERQPAQTAHLHIVGGGAVALAKPVINIGREAGNDVVISDAFVSRHHIQLRKRAGVYTLFDVNSRGGTLVNETAVSEHRLQNGDVIRIGRTDIVFAEDYSLSHINGTTQVLRPG